MRHFKKGLLLGLGLIALILLIVYIPRTQTLNLQYIINGHGDSRVTLYYQGDRVIKLIQTSTTFYEAMWITDPEEIKEMQDSPPIIKEDRPGFKYRRDYDKDRYVEVVELDYDKLDLSAPDMDLDVMLSEDGKSVSFEKMKSWHISVGYKVVKWGKFQELPKP